MKPSHSHLPKYLALSALSLALAACGGGSSSALNTNTPITTASISGALIDGPIAGAHVFLDLNNNQTLDDGEPTSGATQADGSFSIDTTDLSAELIAGASLVSIVPDTAKDRDDGGLTLAQAGRKGSTYISPMSAYVSASQQNLSQTVVSPLTTMVASAVINDGMTLTEAKARVRNELQLDATQDPMAHYINDGDVPMARKARATADAMGEAKSLLSTSLTASNETMSASETVATITGAVRDQMTKAMADSTTHANIVGAATPLTPSVLLSKLNTSGSDQHIANRVGGLPETLVQALHRRSSGVAQPVTTTTSAQTFTVVFKDDFSTPDAERDSLMTTHGGSVVASYSHVFKGFTAAIPGAAANAFLAAVSSNPNVQLVEGQSQFRRHATRVVDATTQWGLDALDGQVDGQYAHEHNGAGATVFVVDTGIQANHSEFVTSASDASSRVNTTLGTNTISTGGSTADDEGHGTHVAGTIAGLNVGVADGAYVVPVKVLDSGGAGSLSSVLSGLDWVSGTVANDVALSQHAAVNLSLGGTASAVLDLAAAKLVDQGIPVIAAAGNNNANACDYSPAREPKVITVGAVAFNGDTSTSSIAQKYTRAYYSNFGPCVDVYAPGSVISSAALDGTTTEMSGTSMATPHVAGVVAQWLQAANADVTVQNSFTPADIQQWITSTAAVDQLISAGPSSPNRLLQAATVLPSAETPVTPTLPTTPVVDTAVSLADIQGQAIRRGNFWQAAAAVIVTDANGTAIPDAKVTGHFTVGTADFSASCTTAANGACAVGSNLLPGTVTSVVYAPDTITGTNLSYDAAANAVTSVTINAPTASSRPGHAEREGHPRFHRDHDD